MKIAEKLAHRQDILFVFSGMNKGPDKISNNIQFLGYLDDAVMPALVNAIDVMLILNHDNPFGRYSYPIKIYESDALSNHAAV